MGKGFHPEEFSVEIRNKAIREALNEVPLTAAKAVLADCGLTKEEQMSLLEHKSGSDLTRISFDLYLSDRTVDRRRASGLKKLRTALEN